MDDVELAGYLYRQAVLTGDRAARAFFGPLLRADHAAFQAGSMSYCRACAPQIAHDSNACRRLCAV